MPCQEAKQRVEQTRPDRKPCRLKMEIAAPAVLIREHVPIAGGDGIPGGWQVQIEPRAHVYVAGLTPVKPWMRKHNLSSADQQREKRDSGSPMGHAHERGVALPARGRHCRTKRGRSRRLANTAISHRQTRMHTVGPIPNAPDSTVSAQLAPPREAPVACSTANLGYLQTRDRESIFARLPITQERD